MCWQVEAQHCALARRRSLAKGAVGEVDAAVWQCGAAAAQSSGRTAAVRAAAGATGAACTGPRTHRRRACLQQHARVHVLLQCKFRVDRGQRRHGDGACAGGLGRQRHSGNVTRAEQKQPPHSATAATHAHATAPASSNHPQNAVCNCARALSVQPLHAQARPAQARHTLSRRA